jgi:shikimate dehydrogenase
MSKALKLGVLGSTLAHSKSPQIQEAGLHYLGVEGSYDLFEIAPEEFNSKVNLLFHELNGLNVTIPYKQTITKYLNYSDPLVERIGATNTLVIRDGQIHGYNTDYFGFTQSLVAADLKGKPVSIIGAGGASRAIIIALEDMGVSEINIYVRNLHKVEGTLPKVKKTQINLKLYTEEENFSNSALIVNATPVGQGRLGSSMPITIEQIELLRAGTIIYDLIYSDTQFLQEAQKCKHQTINGSKMLILQGAQSLSLWTGKQITDGLIEAMTSGFSGKTLNN